MKKPNTKLAELRKKAKLTQQELADEMEVSKSYIAKIEIGARRPGIDLADRLACRFKQTVDRLFLRP